METLPAELLNSLEGLEGFNRRAFEEAHEPKNRVTSIRVNPRKPFEPEFRIDGHVPWSLNGSYVSERPYFTHDPLFHAGCYYVQEPGSMFLEQAISQTLNLSKPLKVLDACAAPGGKSTLIAGIINDESLLVGNEVVRNRATVLADNLTRWGQMNTVVTNSDSELFEHFPDYFDALVVDAPCSGSGLFRKQPEAIDEWSPAAVESCSIRQRSILSSLLPSLKAGGMLYYCTCSYSREENEDIVTWLIESGLRYVPLEIDPNWGIVNTGKGYRFYPHLAKSEGFFLAVLTKPEDEIMSQSGNVRSKSKGPGLVQNEKVIRQIVGYKGLIININEFAHLANGAVVDFIEKAKNRLYFRKAGTRLGEFKGKDFVPDHELAYSLSMGPFKDRLELDHDQAIAYLKKADFSVPGSTPGLKLVCYRGYGIGWGKVLERRFNNYLPASFRVLN